MTKQGGMGDRLFVAGYNISGDIGSLQRIGGGPAVLGFTDITQSAEARKGGTLQGAIEFNSYFDPATGMSHKRLSPLPTTDVIATYGRGAALGSPAACVVAKQANYDGNRGQDGSFMLASSFLSSAAYPLEWGRQLTAGIRTDTAATNGSSVDFSAAGVDGLQAYLHVFAFTGTSVTVKLQESSNDGGGDAFADVVGGGFTAATGITSQRIATAAGLAVERYLRVVTTGTFSDAQFAVTVIRNEIAITY